MSEYEMLLNKINKYKDIELDEIKRTEIDDIKNIKINDNLPSKERIIEFIKKIENPYVIKVNDTLVKFAFKNENISGKKCINNIIKNNV